MKEELVALLKAHARDVSQLKRTLAAVTTPQIRAASLKNAAHATAKRWFDEVKPVLERGHAPADVVEHFSELFETLMRLSRAASAKSTYVNNVDQVLRRYHSDLIHAAEIGSFSAGPTLSIAPYLEGLTAEEGTYLDEAQRCLSVNALKACIVLGWCATVARIHEKIGKLGYDKFSQATEEMAAKDYGRFKQFKKKMKIESLSELQRVFDTDLLLVIEYLQLIEGNQHQRLRHCFDLRNHSAHPGQAPIEPENVYAFYSDITKIVLKNPNFA